MPPLILRNANFNVLGRVNLDSQSILAMGTGRLDISTYLNQLDDVNENDLVKTPQKNGYQQDRHPLVQRFIEEGPLVPMFHRNWDPKSDSIIQVEDFSDAGEDDDDSECSDFEHKLPKAREFFTPIRPSSSANKSTSTTSIISASKVLHAAGSSLIHSTPTRGLHTPEKKSQQKNGLFFSESSSVSVSSPASGSHASVAALRLPLDRQHVSIPHLGE